LISSCVREGAHDLERAFDVRDARRGMTAADLEDPDVAHVTP
jgi:hypothetical protein